jgi:hypothetical protein
VSAGAGFDAAGAGRAACPGALLGFDSLRIAFPLAAQTRSARGGRGVWPARQSIFLHVAAILAIISC